MRLKLLSTPLPAAIPLCSLIEADVRSIVRLPPVDHPAKAGISLPAEHGARSLHNGLDRDLTCKACKSSIALKIIDIAVCQLTTNFHRQRHRPSAQFFSSFVINNMTGVTCIFNIFLWRDPGSRAAGAGSDSRVRHRACGIQKSRLRSEHTITLLKNL